MFTSFFPYLPQRLWRAVPLLLLASLTLTALPVLAVDKENHGFGLDRTFAVTGAYGFGKRQGMAGQSGLLRAEGAGYFMTTPMNNRGGLEGGVELGYDGLDHNDAAATQGFLWDLWLGFPVTLFEKQSDDEMLFTSAIAPGMGISSQHAYVYIKGKVAARIVPKVSMELDYQWTPYMGSASWDTNSAHAGLSLATLRYATYFAVGDEVSLMAYFDWRQSNLETPTPGADPALQQFSGGVYNSGSFSPIVRARWDNNFRIGFGVAF